MTTLIEAMARAVDPWIPDYVTPEWREQNPNDFWTCIFEEAAAKAQKQTTALEESGYVVVPDKLPNEVLADVGAIDGYAGGEDSDPESLLWGIADANHQEWWSNVIAALKAAQGEG